MWPWSVTSQDAKEFDGRFESIILQIAKIDHVVDHIEWTAQLNTHGYIQCVIWTTKTEKL